MQMFAQRQQFFAVLTNAYLQGDPWNELPYMERVPHTPGVLAVRIA